MVMKSGMFKKIFQKENLRLCIPILCSCFIVLGTFIPPLVSKNNILGSWKAETENCTFDHIYLNGFNGGSISRNLEQYTCTWYVKYNDSDKLTALYIKYNSSIHQFLYDIKSQKLSEVLPNKDDIRTYSK